MNYRIKKLKTSDFNNFWQVFEKSFLTSFNHIPLKSRKKLLKHSWSNKNFKKRYKNKKILILHTIIRKKTIAYLVSSLENGGLSLMRWIWVKPEHRKKGIAGNLINNWQKWAKEKGCHKLRLISVEKNKIFYQKLGFKKEGKLKKDRYKNDYYILGKIIRTGV
jgi:ribosomal protein S18 acetylase RimI-like enzyme